LELLSVEFIMSLLAIIMVDLVLAGDNAVVIGLAARNIPKEKQKTVIIWGTIGAVVIRLVATILVVWLLKIPGLLLVGGVVLIWIAYKLLIEEKKHDNIAAKSTMLQAISTVIVADMMMGIDNVIAVAGVADGDMLLIVLGLIISVPIMVFGSTFVIVLMDKFPIVIYIGSGILAFTAGKMMLDEPFLESVVEPLGLGKWIIIGLIVTAVIAAGKLTKVRRWKRIELDHKRTEVRMGGNDEEEGIFGQTGSE
jgi:YjbE family integral membrane protein